MSPLPLEPYVLNDPQIQKLMKQALAALVPAKDLLEVRTEPLIDPEGREALRITLVLTEHAAKELTGDQLLSLLTEIHDSLLREGDERFPVLFYATPGDLGDDEED